MDIEHITFIGKAIGATDDGRGVIYPPGSSKPLFFAWPHEGTIGVKVDIDIDVGEITKSAGTPTGLSWPDPSEGPYDLVKAVEQALANGADKTPAGRKLTEEIAAWRAAR